MSLINRTSTSLQSTFHCCIEQYFGTTTSNKNRDDPTIVIHIPTATPQGQIWQRHLRPTWRCCHWQFSLLSVIKIFVSRRRRLDRYILGYSYWFCGNSRKGVSWFCVTHQASPIISGKIKSRSDHIWSSNHTVNDIVISSIGLVLCTGSFHCRNFGLLVLVLFCVFVFRLKQPSF